MRQFSFRTLVSVRVNGFQTGLAANSILSAASTKHRLWQLQQCRKRQRYKRCWPWFVLPESSGSPAGIPSVSEAPPAPLPLALNAAHLPGLHPVCFPVGSWLPTIPPERCSVHASVVPVAVGGTRGATGSVCRWGGGLSRLPEALRPTLKLRSACLERRRPWVRSCHSKWVWGCQWLFAAPPAGNDGFQPELWGLPAGSLGLSVLRGANSSAPENERNTATKWQRCEIMEYFYDVIVFIFPSANI